MATGNRIFRSLSRESKVAEPFLKAGDEVTKEWRYDVLGLPEASLSPARVIS